MSEGMYLERPHEAAQSAGQGEVHETIRLDHDHGMHPDVHRRCFGEFQLVSDSFSFKSPGDCI
jgi:hypothetical protein